METKKIYRSDSEYMIAGVCGGLGEYFQVDTTLIRIIFVLLAFGGGAGIIIYLILAFIIPKKNGSNKVNIEENIENVTEDIAKNISSKAKKVKIEINRSKKINVFGLILIILGIMFLWNTFGFFKIDSEILWPSLLIILGFSILFK